MPSEILQGSRNIEIYHLLMRIALMWTAKAALPAFSSMKKTSAQPYLLEDWKPCLKINPERNSLENSGPKTFFHPEFTLQLQRKSISFDFKQCILSNSQILSLTKPSNVVLDQVLPLEIVSFTWYNPRQSLGTFAHFCSICLGNLSVHCPPPPIRCCLS